MLSYILSIVFPMMFFIPPVSAGPEAPTIVHNSPIVVDNFSAYRAGGLPTRWKRLVSRNLEPLQHGHLRSRENVEVVREGNRQFLRLAVDGVVSQLILPNGEGYDWNLETHPRLRWDWRALELPEGAREDQNRLNDTGAALYVTFSMNIFGQPRSIKYTYSSTLPVGTVVRYSGLRVMVVATGKDGFGSWKTMDRNVVQDYRQLWGGDPPSEPLSISLWSDADTVPNARAKADFDNISVLPARR